MITGSDHTAPVSLPLQFTPPDGSSSSRQFLNTLSAIQIQRKHSRNDFVQANIVSEPFSRLGIEIVRVDETPMQLRSWDRKRTDTREHIPNHIPFLEILFAESIVFRVQPGVPVDFPEIEFETTILGRHSASVIRFPGEQFHREDSEFVLDHACLVDDGSDVLLTLWMADVVVVLLRWLMMSSSGHRQEDEEESK